MTFFEYACREVNKTYKRCGYAGICGAAKIPGGYVFGADLGPKDDGKTVFADDYLFAFEDTKEIHMLDWRSEKYNELLDQAVVVEVPDKYLSPRILAQKID